MAATASVSRPAKASAGRCSVAGSGGLARFTAIDRSLTVRDGDIAPRADHGDSYRMGSTMPRICTMPNDTPPGSRSTAMVSPSGRTWGGMITVAPSSDADRT